MEGMAAVLLLIFIAVVIVVNVFYRLGKQKKPAPISYILPDLGIQKHNATFERNMKMLIEHLRESYPDHYVDRVKERVVRQSQISLVEWEHRWFEWERYLIMTAILRSVQMYSPKVDEVWHEMLMFTREYKEFSKKYLNMMLHHIPNAPDVTLSPHERAWFDLIYVLLFQPTRYSRRVWGSFLRHPLSEEVIKDFQTLSTDLLQKKYFNTYAAEHVPRVAELITLLIQLIRDEIITQKNFAQAYDTNTNYFCKQYLKKKEWSHPSLQLLAGVLYLSTYHHSDFYDHYVQLYQKVVPKTGSADYETGTYHFPWDHGEYGCNSDGENGAHSCGGSSCGSGN